MDLGRLRESTRAEHDATENTVPLMSETLTLSAYRDVLRRFYRIVAAWDGWADAHAPVDLLPTLATRRRAALLAADLLALGAPELPGDIPSARMDETTVLGDPRAVFLGRMYVMEGSTLGGQYIARFLEEQLHLQHGAGNSFFVGYGEHTGARWNEFKALLSELPESATDTVILSAKNMFALFGEAMRSPFGPAEKHSPFGLADETAAIPVDTTAANLGIG